MGFVVPDRADVAISYRHGDEDFSLGWIGRFHADLSQALRGALQRKGKSAAEAKELHVAKDTFDLAQGGDVNVALTELIGQASVLVVIAGAAYPYSEYCAREIEIFQSRDKGNIDVAIEHTFIVVVDKEFFFHRRKNETPSGMLSEQERQAAERVRRLTNDRLFQEFFSEQTGGPIDRERSEYQRKAGELAKSIADLLIAARDKGSGRTTDTSDGPIAVSPSPSADRPSPSADHWVLAPIIDERLKESRDLLVKTLDARGIATECLTFDDVMEGASWSPHKLALRLNGAQGLIQVFDDGRPEYGVGDQLLGHLALALDASRKAERTKVIWWWPEDKVGGPLSDSDEFKDFLRKINHVGTSGMDLESLIARDFEDRTKDKSQKDRIDIGVVGDKEHLNILRPYEEIQDGWRQRWKSTNCKRPDIVFWHEPWRGISSVQGAPWEPSQPYQGFVLLVRNQDELALKTKINEILKKTVEIDPQRAASVFVLPPEQELRSPVPATWPVLVLRGSDEEPTVEPSELEKFLTILEERLQRLGVIGPCRK